MITESKTEVAFNIQRPFRTAIGWPARLIGVLQRRANPYVVAVWNPNYKSEELHAYPLSGKHMGTIEAHPLDLEEISDDEYYAWAAAHPDQPQVPTHAFIIKEPSWPVNANPMRLDTTSMGTELVRGWHLLHAGYDNKSEPRPLTSFKMYNDRTGDVFSVYFTPMDKQELEAT